MSTRRRQTGAQQALLTALSAGMLAALLSVPAAAATTTSPLAVATAPMLAAAASASAASFQFGVIGHSFKSSADETPLRQAIASASQQSPAFIVATGIKSTSEPCSDRLYGQRRALFNDSSAPLILSLAGSDWSACQNSAGRSAAIERLNRVRELFYSDAESLGMRHLPLTRQSGTAKFRSYAENAHWQVGKVLFATINLPANNNHYRAEAGRNSEYEDRLVANRAWLNRLFSLAQRQKLQGLVLFSDGAVTLPESGLLSLLPSFRNKQDGFAEPRRQIHALAEKFSGQVLLIDAQGSAGGETVINWRGNVGYLSLATSWTEIGVNSAAAPLFSLRASGADVTP